MNGRRGERRALLLLLLASVVLGGCEPVLMLPGGALAGTAAPVPDDWSALRDVRTVQLETRPGDPYSVNVWVIGRDGFAYVHAGANRATWVEHIEADPAVRLRVGERLYILTATRVTNPAEFERFATSYARKYDRRPRNENVAEAYLYRLTPRG